MKRLSILFSMVVLLAGGCYAQSTISPLEFDTLSVEMNKVEVEILTSYLDAAKKVEDYKQALVTVLQSKIATYSGDPTKWWDIRGGKVVFLKPKAVKK